MTRRLLLAVLAAVVAVTTAVGPSRLAAASGLVRAADGSPGFLPEPTPVRVTAPTVRISLLRSILDDQQIPLAGGGQSPRGTVLLEFAGIELDGLHITQNGSSFALAISNGGGGDRAATIGGAGQTVHLWGVLKRLNVCLASLPGPEACPDIARGVGALSLLIRAGGKLPEVLRGKNLDIDVYALTVKAPKGSTSLGLPLGRLSVTAK
ncbi:MAG TPA: hypothetical protein VNC22_03400 [Sporichthya sp.]|nr:hypothetical protein [Sporichthya sp.]